MEQWEPLHSSEDLSVNIVLRRSDKEVIETRFVQRHDDYFICYLSSHTGCAHSCRFCHLTATKQTIMTPVSISEYLEQADQILKIYMGHLIAGKKTAQTIHFNFMARGEALSNPHFCERSSELFRSLSVKADVFSLFPKFLISTIMPRDFEGDLTQILAHPNAVPYYSLYSINPDFRKRWLPKAMDPREALEKLAAFQKETGRVVVLHWAFIKDENDRDEDIDALLDLVDEVGLKARFNLVRYNPHDSRHGTEPSEERLQELLERIQARLTLPGSRIVPRVGHDVYASCGCFIESKD